MVSGTSTVPAFPVFGTTVYIVDDDGRGVTVSDTNLTVNEGSSETYTVVLRFEADRRCDECCRGKRDSGTRT